MWPSLLRRTACSQANGGLSGCPPWDCSAAVRDYHYQPILIGKEEEDNGFDWLSGDILEAHMSFLIQFEMRFLMQFLIQSQMWI